MYTYTRNMANVALSIRVTLNTKPASQVLIKTALHLILQFYEYSEHFGEY